MILSTVTNNKFFLSSINLIESYKHNSFNKEILFYYFDLDEVYLDFLQNRYGSQIILKEVERVCDYAHSPRMFFYKVAAIHGASKFGHDFIYSDATNAFVNMTVELKRDVKKSGCLFLKYHPEQLKNKYWTTEACFTQMGCDSERYRGAPQYWAGYQCYESNHTNSQFINEMYNCSLNLEIIGPDTTVKKPDGPESLCIEHRQDQSILSLLIEKYNLQQDYESDILNKYGDQQTLVSFDPSYTLDPNKIVLFSRMSKFGDCRFVSDTIRQKLDV
jgi:hypothetical protein